MTSSQKNVDMKRKKTHRQVWIDNNNYDIIISNKKRDESFNSILTDILKKER